VGGAGVAVGGAGVAAPGTAAEAREEPGTTAATAPVTGARTLVAIDTVGASGLDAPAFALEAESATDVFAPTAGAAEFVSADPAGGTAGPVAVAEVCAGCAGAETGADAARLAVWAPLLTFDGVVEDVVVEDGAGG
jgi:hypothetical protein